MGRAIVRADRIVQQETRAIRRLNERAMERSKRLVADIVEIGKRLSRVKEHVGHGNWTPWLDRNFGWSNDMAERFVRVFQLSKSTKFRSLRNLPLELLYFLARKSTPEEMREVAVTSVKAGKPVRSVRELTTYVTISRPPAVPAGLAFPIEVKAAKPLTADVREDETSALAKQIEGLAARLEGLDDAEIYAVAAVVDLNVIDTVLTHMELVRRYKRSH
jgi:hypothetical protein